MNQKSDNINLIVFMHSARPYTNYSLECSQKLRTLYYIYIYLFIFFFFADSTWSNSVEWNKLDEMGKLLSEFHKYVLISNRIGHLTLPNGSSIDYDDSSRFFQILFGGDQLTVASARGAQSLRTTHDSAKECSPCDWRLACTHDLNEGTHKYTYY